MTKTAPPTLDDWHRRQRRRARVQRGSIATLLILGVVVITVARPRSAPALPDDALEARLPVKNLDCPVWCPVRVDSAIATLPGVGRTALDFHRGEVVVQFDPDRISVKDLQDRLDEWSFPSRGEVSLRRLAETVEGGGSPEELGGEKKGVEAHQR